MKKIIFALLLISGLSFVNSCTTDFDLYADYKDISVVYGLLDISDDTSWIKITKAFVGPGNALLIARNEPDSSNYSYKLDVKLIGIKNGVEQAPIVFDTLTLHNKRPGDSTFYFPDQLVYFATSNLDPNAKYSLLIDNKGKVITSETPLVGGFPITHPNLQISFISSTGKITWDLAENGKRYEVSLIFNYKELHPGSSDTLSKKMFWFLGIDKDDDGVVGYMGETFFNKLEADLEEIPGVKRWDDKVDIMVACGAEILNSYIEINEADNSLLTEVPVFSNIEGGTGVFSSRHSTYKTVVITQTTRKKLVEDYPDLGFQYPTK